MTHITQLFDLTGRVALVTGGSRGLGAEMAEGLAEAGATLMLVARREQWLNEAVEQMRSRGFRCEGIPCDVSKPEAARAAVLTTTQTFGRVDVLVNAAGISWGSPAEDMPLDRWTAVLDVDLTGAFLFCQEAGHEMIRQKYGRIINVASISGLVGSMQTGVHTAGYSAAKGGLIALTRELAANWAQYNIRVNAIAPGFFQSRMTEKVLEKIKPEIEAQSPMKRIGRPGELKGAAVFLASDASNYITGQTIVVDGGTTIV